VKKPTVIFDFDGVIHSYTSGWKGADVIPDGPVQGIAEAIAEIRQHYTVVVVSTRCYQDGGIDAIREWLGKHGIEVDDVTGEKPPAIIQIDDRSVTFDGVPANLLKTINGFQPWNKKPVREANQTIENNFRYHAPKPGQPEKYTAIREKAKELAYLIDELAPKSREQSLAYTKLEEAVMWANAAIARNE